MFSRCSLPALLILFLLLSCTTTQTIDTKSIVTPPSKNEQSTSISLLFAGDIMAHTVNYRPGKFSRIWTDIEPLVKSCDLAFANIEAPVNDSMDWSSYPQFNMHSSYIDEVIKTGFNVFSLANNHTNDWFLDGIKATRSYFAGKSDIWANGVKAKSNEPLTYSVIEKNNFKILFIAYTEILNRNDYSSYIDYYPFTEKGRSKLLSDIKTIKDSTDFDLFVLSVHTSEEEYVRTVTQSHSDFFHTLINECSVDIIWANHPHVVKNWETYEHNGKKSFIMYANGNTISGQRYAPSFNKPDTDRDYTGDGLTIKVKLTKHEGSHNITFDSIEPYFITTFVTPSGQYVVRLLDDDLIHSLYRADLRTWSQYLKERKELMEQIKGTQVCQ